MKINASHYGPFRAEADAQEQKSPLWFQDRQRLLGTHQTSRTCTKQTAFISLTCVLHHSLRGLLRVLCHFHGILRVLGHFHGLLRVLGHFHDYHREDLY